MREELGEARPGEAPSPRPAGEPLAPDSAHRPIELPQTTMVGRATVVLVVASQFRVEHPLLVFQRVVAMPLAPVGDRFEPSPQALLHRAHVHRELTMPASGTPVRKPQEVEGGGLGLQPLRLMMGMTPKFNQARLLRMKRQPVLREPLR